MTIIADKLKAAGVKVPSMQERVWRIVRDNPGGITASRVADIFDPSRAMGSVSTLLSQMEQRKMVTSRTEPRFVPGPRGSMTKRDVKLYSTSMREYELLPAPRKQTAATRAMDATQAVVAQVKAGPPTTVIPQPPTVNNAAAFVEKMTIAEARALWAELNKMFGAKQ